MLLVDTHSHPQFSAFDEDRDEMLAKTEDEKIGIICVGTDLNTSQGAIDLAARYTNIWASVGLHPNENSETVVIEKYRRLAENDKVVAIGEIGLDYYRGPEAEQKRRQRIKFEKFLDLAQRHSLPAIIHCRDAHKDMIDTLHHWRYRKHVKGVIHSFTGKWEDAKKYIDIGFYIGLNGIVTFTDQYNDTASRVPLDRILLETDAPYLTPEPYRGHKNEPSNVKLVAYHLAHIRNVSFEHVTHVTTINARKLFNLD